MNTTTTKEPTTMNTNVTPSAVTINGTTYYPTPTPPAPWRIIIAQRGWVFVGRHSIDPDNGEVCLHDASVIRVWGTTKGLGELATNGPLSGTKLDPCPPVRLHPMTVVAAIDAPGFGG